MTQQTWEGAKMTDTVMYVGTTICAAMMFAAGPTGASAATPRRNSATTSPGNNAEAESFAKDMSTPGAVWRLELTPEEMTGRDVVQYRRNVSVAKATVTVKSSEWVNNSETQQRNMIKVWMNTLHKPPLMSLSKVLDYYPNSSGEIVVLAE